VKTGKSADIGALLARILAVLERIERTRREPDA
jgi:hypothetical protein